MERSEHLLDGSASEEAAASHLSEVVGEFAGFGWRSTDGPRHELTLSVHTDSGATTEVRVRVSPANAAMISRISAESIRRAYRDGGEASEHVEAMLARMSELPGSRSAMEVLGAALDAMTESQTRAILDLLDIALITSDQ